MQALFVFTSLKKLYYLNNKTPRRGILSNTFLVVLWPIISQRATFDYCLPPITKSGPTLLSSLVLFHHMF
jgi:hypothetical protein